jgi:hypothetical protein
VVHQLQSSTLALLQILEAFIQTVETSIPEPPIDLKAPIDARQRLDPNSAWPPLRITTTSHKPSRFQHANVFGHRSSCHFRRLGEFGNGRFACQKAGQNSASRRTSERGES